MFKVIDVDGRTTGGPLVGRLRGVNRRGFLRPVVRGKRASRAEFVDPHFRAKRALPAALPPVLPNLEHQFLVTKVVADTLQAHVPDLVTRAVRIEDQKGTAVATYQMIEVSEVARGMDAEGAGFIRGYHFDSFDNLSVAAEIPEALPPLFHSSYTSLICARQDLVAPLEAAGAVLVHHEALEGPPFEVRALGYQILKVGTEGAELLVEGGMVGELDVTQALQDGQSITERWLPEVIAKMQPPKSRKKVVDVLSFSGATILSKKARAVIEPFLDGEAEFLDILVHKHDDTPARGTFCVFHVTATRPVHGEESDVELDGDKLWSVREIEFDTRAVEDKPAFFRLPNARYSWVFVRDDVVTAMTAAKLTGFGVRHPDAVRWPVENKNFNGL